MTNQSSHLDTDPFFDADSWAELPNLLGHLPEPVHLVVWGDPTNPIEAEAVRLCAVLAERFAALTTETLPRRPTYHYWPVIGIMRPTAVGYDDLGLRIIGLPNGYAMTSFITAIQAVSFRGMTSEAVTRIRLNKLAQPIEIQMITDANNEAGALMAHPLFNMAVSSPLVRVFMIMGDQFPAILDRYSVQYVPHTIINGRVHIEGVVDEAIIMRHIGQAAKTSNP